MAATTSGVCQKSERNAILRALAHPHAAAHKSSVFVFGTVLAAGAPLRRNASLEHLKCSVSQQNADSLGNTEVPAISSLPIWNAKNTRNTEDSENRVLIMKNRELGVLPRRGHPQGSYESTVYSALFCNSTGKEASLVHCVHPMGANPMPSGRAAKVGLRPPPAIGAPHGAVLHQDLSAAVASVSEVVLSSMHAARVLRTCSQAPPTQRACGPSRPAWPACTMAILAALRAGRGLMWPQGGRMANAPSRRPGGMAACWSNAPRMWVATTPQPPPGKARRGSKTRGTPFVQPNA